MMSTTDFLVGSAEACIRALRELEQTAIMLEKWGPECFPENEHGQVHFARALMDSAATAIRKSWSDAVREAEQLPVWKTIDTAPTDKTMFLAATADGRMMIFRGDLLAHAMKDQTPNHLTFPATHWRALPSLPEKV